MDEQLNQQGNLTPLNQKLAITPPMQQANIQQYSLEQEQKQQQILPDIGMEIEEDQLQQAQIENEKENSQIINETSAMQINQMNSANQLSQINQISQEKNNNVASSPSTASEAEEGNKVSEEEKLSLLKNRKICGLIEGCDNIENYVHLNKIHEGVFGVVFRAKDKLTDEIFAIKKVKLNHMTREGFPISSVREIQLLMNLSHPNIVKLREILIGSNLDRIYVVMEYMEHEIKDLMDHTKHKFSQAELKSLMRQFLQGIEYLHSRCIFHRDLKTSNLLYNNKGQLKICDFGLARKFASTSKNYTPIVVTLWYRSPEILLGCENYTAELDIWSIGCIFAELILKAPLLPGQKEAEQIDMIFKTFGTPTDQSWPNWRNYKLARQINFKKYPIQDISQRIPPSSQISESGLDLMRQMLKLDPAQRITASKALKHKWFDENPRALDQDLMPTFPPMNEQPRELRKQQKINAMEFKQ